MPQIETCPGCSQPDSATVRNVRSILGGVAVLDALRPSPERAGSNRPPGNAGRRKPLVPESRCHAAIDRAPASGAEAGNGAVPGAGVEPARLAAADFKSAASAVPPPGHNNRERGAPDGTPRGRHWRRRPDSNRWWGFCRPLPYHLATAPEGRETAKGRDWSGRRDSNSRPPPWQGGALPLSHFRKAPARAPAGTGCRGGDLNSYARKGTTPSRWRVCLFHHLGRRSAHSAGAAGVEGLEPPTGGFGDRCSTG